MKIEKIRIKNFKVFKDTEILDLPNLCVFLGSNGSGKSTLFEVFGFLSDALKGNVKTAFNKRGGYKEVYSRNGEGDIEIEIKFRNPDIDGKKQPLVRYEIIIGLLKGSPVVVKEILSYGRGRTHKPYMFLDFKYGKGKAITNEAELIKDKENFKEKQENQTKHFERSK